MTINWGTYYIAAIPIFAIFSIVGTLLNFIVIGIYIKRPHIQKKVSNILILQQRVVDLVNCGPLCIGQIIWLYYHLEDSCTTHKCKKTERLLSIQQTRVLGPFVLALSTFSYVGVGIDRILAVFAPYFYRLKMGRKYAISFIVVAWVAAIVVCSPSVSIKFDSPDYRTYAIPACTIVIVSFLVNNVLFIATFIKSQKCLRKLVQTRIADTTTVTVEIVQPKIKRSYQELHLIKVFVIMYAGFVIGFLSFICFSLIMISDKSKHASDRQRITWEVSLILIASSSILNPALTLAMRKDFHIQLGGVS